MQYLLHEKIIFNSQAYIGSLFHRELWLSHFDSAKSNNILGWAVIIFSEIHKAVNNYI